MLGRDKKPSNPLWELRDSLLSDAPAARPPVIEGTQVWGVLIETGYPDGPVTLLALSDGTTSLYLPSGGGVIGAGEHTPVKAAAHALMVTADALRSALQLVADTAFPEQGRVRIFVLTSDGVIFADADERELGEGTGPLSAIFHAGEAVLTQLRIVCQAAEHT